MTKELFLEILKNGLSDFPENELNDILYDYKEHFDVGFASGKSEENIISELGEPYDIVSQYRNGYLKKYETNNEENTTKNNKSNIKSNDKTNNLIITSIIIILSLILFGPLVTGLAFTIIGLFLGMFGVSLSLIITSIGILLGKFVTNTIGIFEFPIFMLNFPDSVLILIFFGALCSFILSILCLYYLMKQFIRWMKILIKFISTKLKEV